MFCLPVLVLSPPRVGFSWLIFLLFVGCVFLLLCMPSSLWWDRRCCEWVPNTPINIVELYSGTQFSFMETEGSSQALLLKLLRQEQSSVGRSSSSLLLRQGPWEYSTQCIWVMRSSSLAVGPSPVLHLLWASVWSFQVIFFPPMNELLRTWGFSTAVWRPLVWLSPPLIFLISSHSPYSQLLRFTLFSIP